MKTDRKPVSNAVASNYIFPAPPRPRAELIIRENVAAEDVAAEDVAAPVLTKPTDKVAQAFGERFLTQAQSLDLLLVEVRDRLDRLDISVVEDSRAQIKGCIRELAHVVDWCDALRGEMEMESAKALDGQEPIDLVSLCEEQARHEMAAGNPIHVSGADKVVCWADRARLSHLLQKALSLVLARTKGRGLRSIDVQYEQGAARIRICSRGDAVGDLDAGAAARFRTAADNAGVRVLPDALGAGVAGMVLRLPG